MIRFEFFKDNLGIRDKAWAWYHATPHPIGTCFHKTEDLQVTKYFTAIIRNTAKYDCDGDYWDIYY